MTEDELSWFFGGLAVGLAISTIICIFWIGPKVQEAAYLEGQKHPIENTTDGDVIND